jgi:hypothetical protein
MVCILLVYAVWSYVFVLTCCCLALHLSILFVVNAPVTLSFMLMNGLCRLLGAEKAFFFNMSRVVNHYEIYRLLTSGIVFNSPPVFLTGLIVAHVFRDIERQMGSFKFVSFMTLSFVLTTASQMALSVAVPLFSGNQLRYLPACGAYFYILTCLPLYWRK